MRIPLALAVLIGASAAGAEPISNGEWATPSTIRSKSAAMQLPPPEYPVRLKWVAEVIPADSRKLQAIILSKDGTNIDIVYHYDRKQKTRIPSQEIIEWGVRTDGSTGPAHVAPIVVPFSLIFGTAGLTQKFTVYISFLDADGKPFTLVFDPYDNGRLLASLLNHATGLEPGEPRSAEYIKAIKDGRSLAPQAPTRP